MAYARTYYFDFASSNGWEYRLEFYDQINTSPNFVNREGALGGKPASISYSTDGSGMFAPLKPSTMKIEFIVRDIIDQQYIDELRTDRTERDVYVHLYRQNVNGTNNPAAHSPLWSGYLLMDLSDDGDTFFPRTVNLKAVDGIASLKYYHFLPSTTSQISTNAYTMDETFKPTPSNGFSTTGTFIDWIVEALNYGGFAGTAEGAAAVSQIKVVNNWNNGAMSTISQDSLRYTRTNTTQFYKQKDVDGDTMYEAMTCYEVIKSICTTWGMRFTYWSGDYYFIQISSYTENESGTQLNPDNMTTYRYAMDGTPAASIPTIGTWYTKYQINLCSGYSIADSGQQRLAGGRYGILPKLKTVTVDFESVADVNYFTTFPLLADPWYTGTMPAYGQTEETYIGSFPEFPVGQLLYQEIWLNFMNNTVQDMQMEMNWTLVCRAAGTGPSWQKHLYWDFTQATPTPTWVLMSGLQQQYRFDWSIMSGASVNFSAGSTTIDICQSMLSYIPVGPTATGISGDIEFGYMTYAQWGGTNSGNLYFKSHGEVDTQPGSSLSPNDPMGNGISYSNTIPGLGMGSSLLAPIVNGQIGQSISTVSLTTAGAETAYLDVTGVLWGDVGAGMSSGGSLQVYNGSAWVDSGYAGNWGKDTLIGTKSLSNLLAETVLGLQFENAKTFTTKSALAETGRYYNDGTASRPNYITPVSKFIVPAFLNVDERAYIMHTGTFDIVNDQWTLKLNQFLTHTLVGVSTNTTGTGGTNTGGVGTGWQGGGVLTPDVGPSPRMANPNSARNLIEYNRRLAFQPITSLSENVDIDPTNLSPVAVTSLPIFAIGTALLKAGDKISLRTQTSTQTSSFTTVPAVERHRYLFELDADQGASDTTLTVVSKDIYSTLLKGDVISIDGEDLISQYQNKTRGSVGGFDITPTSIDSGAVNISSFINDSSMGTASATAVSTSDAMKTYLNAQIGSVKVGDLQTLVATLSQAQLNSAYSSPIQLVGAKGANKVIIPVDQSVVYVDRNLTNTVNNDVIVGWNSTTAYSESLLYNRRFMYNVATDAVIALSPYARNISTNLADGKDQNLTFALSNSNPTTNCYTEIKIAFAYYVVEIT